MMIRVAFSFTLLCKSHRSLEAWTWPCLLRQGAKWLTHTRTPWADSPEPIVRCRYHQGNHANRSIQNQSNHDRGGDRVQAQGRSPLMIHEPRWYKIHPSYWLEFVCGQECVSRTHSSIHPASWWWARHRFMASWTERVREWPIAPLSLFNSAQLCHSAGQSREKAVVREI